MLFSHGRVSRYNAIDSSDRLLVVGTTLATCSAYRSVDFCTTFNKILILCRLLKHALETRKQVAVLNIGPTRADGILAAQKIEQHSGLVLRDATKSVWCVAAASIDIPS
jgi:NAD-dependent SIR2 family protein deacetylase